MRCDLDRQIQKVFHVALLSLSVSQGAHQRASELALLGQLFRLYRVPHLLVVLSLAEVVLRALLHFLAGLELTGHNMATCLGWLHREVVWFLSERVKDIGRLSLVLSCHSSKHFY